MLLLLLLTLASCAGDRDPSVLGMRALLGQFAAAPEPRLNPAFRYLRVVVDGRTAYLALGNMEGADGRTEVWYSGDRAVLRLHDGRVAGASGLVTEWRRVEQPDAPDWRSARHGGALHWLRIRDVMPGYRIGLRDSMSLTRIDAPDDSNLKGVAPASLAWFEERVSGNPLPPARYAVDFSTGGATVVYAEQCLSRALCFSWQRWSAANPTRE